MTNRSQILSSIKADRFFGRNEIVASLCDVSRKTSVLAAAPGLGTTEILLQTYDELFARKGETVPIYFKFSKSDKNIKAAAQRFGREFLQQAVAFRRNDRAFLIGSHSPSKLLYLLPAADIGWADRLVTTLNSSGDDLAFVRECFSTPLRAAARGRRFQVHFDDFHNLLEIDQQASLIEDLKKIVETDGVKFVVAGRRRSIYGKFAAKNINLEPLSLGDTGRAVEAFATDLDLKISQEARDLIAVQLRSNLVNIKYLLKKAVDKKIELNSFIDVQRVYTEEVFGGYIGQRFDSVIDEILPDVLKKNELISILFDTSEIDAVYISTSAWQNRLGLSQQETDQIIDRLDRQEIIRSTAGRAGVANDDTLITDMIAVRFRLNIAYENRALVYGETLRSNISRAPRLMAEYYRRLSAIGLRQLFEAFNGELVPSALVDYGSFSAEYKGAPNHEILSDLRQTEHLTRLPRIIFSTNTSAMYKPILKFTETERSAVSIGYIDADGLEEETVVISAEIDSKLETAAELTEFWCDRLEMVAIMCGFEKFQIWLFAPEGFSPESMELLRRRNARGMSKKQVELLINQLNITSVMLSRQNSEAETYEIVLPMSPESEMIAAHTIEDIARRYNFDMKAIKQIKTAVVEACINASEHSLSPDKKIYQSFMIDEKGLNLVISNRGIRLTDKMPAQKESLTEGRRGWGLKLIQSLMDEVDIERVDDGTRIRMRKFFTQATQ